MLELSLRSAVELLTVVFDGNLVVRVREVQSPQLDAVLNDPPLNLRLRQPGVGDFQSYPRFSRLFRSRID
ncbi:MAG: hypothetical protein ACTHJM_00705 [Marmoricola sp.]